VFYNQSEFDIRCEWGIEAVERLSPVCDVVIIVDVLSFTTAVDIAASRGAAVYPYRWRDESAEQYAQSLGPVLGGSRSSQGYSLSPASLVNIPSGTRLVLPSPNGATLSLAAGDAVTFAGCLRNAQAVARAARDVGKRILVAPAGERWPDSQTLRPAFEDLVGSGAIIHFLQGTSSPEAALAEAAFHHFQDNLLECLLDCTSGKELVEKGYAADLEIAAAFNSSSSAPRFTEGCFTSSPQP
jgi:2-phosphosulfolactate phosphatase